MDLQVIVLTGTKAQYLYPLAKNTPKMLLPIANKPMLTYVLQTLQRTDLFTFRGILVATPQQYYNKFTKYLGRKYQTLSEMPIQTVAIPNNQAYYGTMGTLKYLKNRINSDCIVISEDCLIDSQILVSFVEKIYSVPTDCCLLLSSGGSSGSLMQIFALSQDRIIQIFNDIDNEQGFSLKRKTLQAFPRLTLKNNLTSVSCYFFSGKLFRGLFQREQVDQMTGISQELIPYILKHQTTPALKEDHQRTIVRVHQTSGFCKQILNTKSFLEMNIQALTPLNGVGKNKKPVRPPPVTLQSTVNSPFNILQVQANQKEFPQFFKQISNDSKVMQNFQIGEKSVVTKCVIGKNVRVGKRCKVVQSVIMDNVVIEDDSNINNSIICNGATICKKAKVLNSQVSHKCQVLQGSMLLEDQQVNQLRI